VGALKKEERNSFKQMGSGNLTANRADGGAGEARVPVGPWTVGFWGRVWVAAQQIYIMSKRRYILITPPRCSVSAYSRPSYEE
jgi:hypothetical protein